MKLVKLVGVMVKPTKAQRFREKMLTDITYSKQVTLGPSPEMPKRVR